MTENDDVLGTMSLVYNALKAPGVIFPKPGTILPSLLIHLYIGCQSLTMFKKTMLSHT